MPTANPTRRTCLAALVAPSLVRAAQSSISAEKVATGLDTPWAIAFLPDGRMMVTERPGRVNLVESGKRRVIARIGVREQGEGGLLGLALHPDFRQTPAVYLYYTSRGSNQVSRFEFRNDALSGETPILTGIPASRIHNGGRLRFGPDNMLYITTGDASQPQRAQNRDSLAGKILRLTAGGDPAPGNPFSNAVFAYGIRNAQGIDWHPETGDPYITNHGPQRRDSISRLEKGADYGWPQTCDQRGDFHRALRCYTDFTIAPGGLAFHGRDAYVGALRGTQLRRIRVAGGRIVAEEAMLSGYGRLREVVVHDGQVYVTTSNRDGRGNPRAGDDRIIRFRPS